MKIGREPERDLERVRGGTQGDRPRVELFVDANGAYYRKQALSSRGVRRGPRRALVRGAGLLRRPRRPRLVRDRAPAGMEIAAGEYGYDSALLPRACSSAGAVDVPAGRCDTLRRHHRLPAGRRALRGALDCRCPRTARPSPRPRCCAVRGAPAPRVLPRPRPHRVDALRRRARARGGRSVRTAPGPGSGSS